MDKKDINSLINLLAVSRNWENVSIAFTIGIAPSDLHRLETANISAKVAALALERGFTIDEICEFSIAKLWDLKLHLKNDNASREFFDRFGGNKYQEATEAAQYYKNYETIEKIIDWVSYRSDTAEMLYKLEITDEDILTISAAGCNLSWFAMAASKAMDKMKAKVSLADLD